MALLASVPTHPPRLRRMIPWRIPSGFSVDHYDIMYQLWRNSRNSPFLFRRRLRPNLRTERRSFLKRAKETYDGTSTFPLQP
jgi:hypothetical protein